MYREDSYLPKWIPRGTPRTVHVLLAILKRRSKWKLRIVFFNEGRLNVCFGERSANDRDAAEWLNAYSSAWQQDPEMIFSVARK